MTKRIGISKRKLESLYLKKGLSSYKIAKIYKCDPGVVQRRLKEHNIPLIYKKEKIIISKKRLYDLYVNKCLSTYKIANLFGCRSTTIYYRLKEYEINTRHKKIVSIPKGKLKKLYWKEELSLSQISERYDCSPSAILGKLKKYKISRRNRSEANISYPKKPFEGDLIMKSYMIGFRIGDLHVKKKKPSHKTITVNSNTTKLAQVKLIKEVFGCYGHFYTKERRGVYEIYCQLDKSFSFLVPKKDNIPKWILNNKRYFFSFLAGYTDAEGCIKVNQGRARYRIGSYDKNLLKQIYNKLTEFNLYPRYILETRAGTIYSGVKMNGDFWRVSVNKKSALLKLFSLLEPYIKHSTKIEDLKIAKNNILERIERFGG